MSTSDAHPGPGPRGIAGAPDRGVVGAVLSVVRTYSFAGWAYVALIAVFHPQTLGTRLTHLAAWPHEDTFGIACFTISFLSALALAVLRAKR